MCYNTSEYCASGTQPISFVLRDVIPHITAPYVIRAWWTSTAGHVADLELPLEWWPLAGGTVPAAL